MSISVLNYPYCDSATLFEQVADQPWAIFLDSGVLRGEKPSSATGDFDVLAIKPQSTLVFQDGVIQFRSGAIKEQLHGDPLSVLQSSIPKYAETEQTIKDVDCAYLPGALGYFSYDLARYYESLETAANNDEELPEMAVGIYHVIMVIDHQQQRTQLVWREGASNVQSIVEEWQELMEWYEEDGQDEADSKAFMDEYSGRMQAGLLNENMDEKEYRECFNRIRSYSMAGDCYQVNLTKRFSTKVIGDAWLSYRCLREVSPAPYGVYFNLPFVQILSNSPESFIQCRDRQVVTSPIKGTKARNHQDKELDEEIANSLLNSEKDRAENLMIVDLMRNDLSRCCELGSVKVPSMFAIHSFANVHHLISTITGVLRKNLHPLDLLKSCFPGGSITGAPKIRAMEIIEELEPHRRGVYCGSIGYIGMDASMETSIAIRTIVVKDSVARFAAGGGLVIDSEVSEEHQEIIDKASIMNHVLVRHSNEGLPDS